MAVTVDVAVVVGVSVIVGVGVGVDVSVFVTVAVGRGVGVTVGGGVCVLVAVGVEVAVAVATGVGVCVGGTVGLGVGVLVGVAVGGNVNVAALVAVRVAVGGLVSVAVGAITAPLSSFPHAERKRQLMNSPMVSKSRREAIIRPLPAWLAIPRLTAPTVVVTELQATNWLGAAPLAATIETPIACPCGRVTSAYGRATRVLALGSAPPRTPFGRASPV